MKRDRSPKFIPRHVLDDFALSLRRLTHYVYASYNNVIVDSDTDIIVDRFAGYDNRWDYIPDDILAHSILFAPTIDCYNRLKHLEGKVMKLVCGIDPFKYTVMPTELDNLGRPKSNELFNLIDRDSIMLWENPPDELPNDFKQSFMYKVMQELYPDKKVKTVRELAYLTAEEFYIGGGTGSKYLRYLLISPLSTFAESNFIDGACVGNIDMFSYNKRPYVQLWLHGKYEPKTLFSALVLDLDDAGSTMLEDVRDLDIQYESDTPNTFSRGVRTLHRCHRPPCMVPVASLKDNPNILTGMPFVNSEGIETESTCDSDDSLGGSEILGYLVNLGRVLSKNNFSLTAHHHYKFDGQYITKYNWKLLLPLFAAACVKHSPNCARYAMYKNLDDTGEYVNDATFTKGCLTFALCTELNHCRSMTTKDLVLYRTSFSVESRYMEPLIYETGLSTYPMYNQPLEQLYECINMLDSYTEYDEDYHYTPYQMRQEIDVYDTNESTGEAYYYYPELHTALDRLQELCWEMYERYLVRHMFTYGLLI